ncbi:S8 family serine peptidase [Streptomyces sp. NPDC005251]|uniref:S8 family serine peptidase n=1 Tax=Streptomyces sp. NPDC005251 TaxID=3157166 RepID=UPI0033ADE671
MIRRQVPRSTAAVAAAAALIMLTPLVRLFAAAGGDAPAPVVVVLRDQLPDVPADSEHLAERKRQVASAQAPLMAEVKDAGGADIRGFVVGNAFSATVSPAVRDALAANPAVASVVPDRTVAESSTWSGDPVRAGNRLLTAAPTDADGRAAHGGPGNGSVCPSDPSRPLLEPEALALTHSVSTPDTPGADRIATGKGVRIAYIADGLDPVHPDFVRSDGSHAIVDHKDFSGDGWDAPSGAVEAFGDASAMVAQGRQSYDLSQFVNPGHPLPAGCTIRVQGIAPGASLVALKAAGVRSFTNTAILRSIDYAVTVAHVDVLNESFGIDTTADNGASEAVSLFNDQAAAAGVTITVSSGDAGGNGTISTLADDSGVISVGASSGNRAHLQTGYAASQLSNGGWSDNRISAISSGGITRGGRTVDLVAPGEAGWALCGLDAHLYTGCLDYKGKSSPIQVFGGTSQAAPLVAGAAADVVEAYRDSHRGASPTPSLVKAFLTGTAADLGLPAQEQGAGLLDVRAAVEAARGYRAPAHDSSPVAVMSGQVKITGAPGSSRTTDIDVTNTSSRSQTVEVGTRAFAPLGSSRRNVPLNSETDPAFTYGTTGATWVHHDVTFSVPAGTDRLTASLAWTGGVRTLGGVTTVRIVRMTLLDPAGTLEAVTRPQGGQTSPNFGTLDIPHPAAGTWKAILYTPAGDSGFTGPVRLETSFQKAVSATTATPRAVTLAPGQNKTLPVRMTMSTSSGDSTRSVILTSSDGRTTSVPVVMRTLVHIDGGTGMFSGSISGGNARPGSPEQTLTYSFRVPKGCRELSVDVLFDDNPHVVVRAVLTAPSGTTAGTGRNAISPTGDDPPLTAAGVSVSTTTSAPGTWLITLVVVNPVDGTELSRPFTGTVDLHAKAGIQRGC